jgi:hypothetical protein
MRLIENQPYKVYGKDMVFLRKEEKPNAKVAFFFKNQTFVKFQHELNDFYENVKIIDLQDIKNRKIMQATENINGYQIEKFADSQTITDDSTMEITLKDAEILSSKMNNLALRSIKAAEALDVMSDGLFDFFMTVKNTEILTKEQIYKGNLMSKISETVAKNELTKLALKNRS